MSKMKILNLAYTDSGGAGKATLLFNNMLNNHGHKSILLLKESKNNNKNVIIFPEKKKKYIGINILLNKIKSLFFLFLLKKKYFFYNRNEIKKHISAKDILLSTPFTPNIIVLHWVSGFINAEVINNLEKETKAKLFWIMIDNSPLTGGCHFPWDCKGYQSSCLNCSAIKLSYFNSLAHKNLEFKKKNLSKNLTLIAASSSDYDRAKNSSLFKDNRIEKILFPIDSDNFNLGNKKLAKNYFSIDTNRKVIFYGASNITDLRKGFQYFQEAILKLEAIFKEKCFPLDDYIILVAGHISENAILNTDIPILNVGTLSEADLIKAYQCADVFVSTSIEDSGPLMINQSIMCGTPVVAFNVGVAIDLVLDGTTGYTSETCNSNSLAENIFKIIIMKDLDYKTMSKYCRKIALKSFSFRACILKYNNLFNS